MNRWDRRESIFHDDADRQQFIETFGAGKGSGRTIDSFHRSPPRFRQNVTLLTDPIDNCFAIHRLLSVVSRRNRRKRKRKRKRKRVSPGYSSIAA